jgi:hypothetical protein
VGNELGMFFNNHILEHMMERILDLITCKWEYGCKTLFRHVYL